MKRTPISIISRSIVTIDGNVADTYFIAMNSSVPSVVLKNIRPGHKYVFLFSQDATGGHTFAWPNTVSNETPLDPYPNTLTVQCFIGDLGNNLLTNAPGAWST
jgi:hypothetical protein